MVKKNLASLISKIKSGEIKLYELEKNFSNLEAISVRRQIISLFVNHSLDNIAKFQFDPAVIYKKNAENVIGGITVPLGVAGPLKIRGEKAQGEYWLPLATTEGALIASVNRGCSLLRQSGDLKTYVLAKKMTRSLIFEVPSIAKSLKVKEWLRKNFSTLKEITKEETNYGELLDFKTWIIGQRFYIRFAFDPKDAMGMNMITFVCSRLASFIEKECSISLISLSGNMCVDKKPSALNAILGRGHTVTAEAIIPSNLLEKKMKVSVKKILSLHHSKNLVGSALSFSLGYNAHYANIVAALFLSLGQDLAHVVEGSQGMTYLGEKDGDLYVSVYLPNLNVGAVGGGTSLPCQKDSFSILDLKQKKIGEKSNELAEVIAGACLAGEISLLSSLASKKDLVKAHKNLGRKRNINNSKDSL